MLNVGMFENGGQVNITIHICISQGLLEQLEDDKQSLAVILSSKYVGPLRDEASLWAEKLKEVADVLELWLDVQDMWQHLEAVFSNSATITVVVSL